MPPNLPTQLTYRDFLPISALCAAFCGLWACGTQPCSTTDGPVVRLDQAFSQCNHYPVAQVAEPRPISKGSQVRLDGSDSYDPDGARLTYFWTLTAPAGSTAVLADADGPTPNFLADRLGVFELTLVVDDGELRSPPAKVAVLARNDGPTALAAAPLSAPLGEALILDGSGSTDPNGDPLTYAWNLSRRPDGSLAALMGQGAQASLVPDLRGVYEASLTVSDGIATSAPHTVRIVAGVEGGPPVANAGPDQTSGLGARVRLDGSATADPDGDPLTYLWQMISGPAPIQLSDTATISPLFLPQVFGEYVFELTVSDGYFESADTVTITVNGEVMLGVGSPGPCLFENNIVVLWGDEGDFRMRDYIHAGYGEYINGQWTGRINSARDTVEIYYEDILRNGNTWGLDFSSHELGEPLATQRRYENADRYPFEDPGNPGLSVGGSGRGCNTLLGSFMIHDMEFTSGDRPVLRYFLASFNQHCERGVPVLRGCVRYTREGQ